MIAVKGYGRKKNHLTINVLQGVVVPTGIEPVSKV